MGVRSYDNPDGQINSLVIIPMAHLSALSLSEHDSYILTFLVVTKKL
jgi:hypothetical protein